MHNCLLAGLEAGEMTLSLSVLAAVPEALGKLTEIEAGLSNPEAHYPLPPDIPQRDAYFQTHATYIPQCRPNRTGHPARCHLRPNAF